MLKIMTAVPEDRAEAVQGCLGPTALKGIGVEDMANGIINQPQKECQEGDPKRV